jgi:hypothetical protein
VLLLKQSLLRVLPDAGIGELTTVVVTVNTDCTGPDDFTCTIALDLKVS